MKPSEQLVSCAVRVYSAALWLYPRRLRARYADDMRCTFEARCASSRSAIAIVVLTIRELVDLMFSAASVSAVSRSAGLSGPRSAALKGPP